MKKIFDFGGFWIQNKPLNILWIISLISIYLYAPLINTTLMDYYGVSEEKLSFLSSAFIVAFLLGSYANKYFMNNHTNIIKVMLYSSCLLFASLIAEASVMYLPSFNFWLFTIFRALDAFASFLLMATISHVLKTVLLTSPSATKINSLQTTISYTTKAIFPILTSLLIVTTDNPINIFTLTFVSLLLLFLFLLKNKRRIYKRYTRILLRQTGKEPRKSLPELKKFFSKDNDGYFSRIYFVIVNFIHNLLRAGYDLILPAALIINYNMDVATAATIYSSMVFGSAMSFKLQFALKYISRNTMYIIHLPLHAIIMSTLFLSEGLSFTYLYALVFVLGMSRSLYYIWDFEFGQNLVSKTITMQNKNFVHIFIAELGHLTGYLLVPILMVATGQYQYIAMFYVSILSLLLIYHFYYHGSDKRRI